MNDYFKMFLIALVTSVAAQLLLTPYIVKLQGLGGTAAPAPASAPVQPPTAPPAEVVEKLSAPNLEGMTVDAARERWRAKGLVIIEDGERSVGEAEPGTIVQQRPSAGAELSSNKEIRVVVAKASSDVAVPKVEGKSYEDARTALVAAGFEVPEPAKEVSEEDAGTVLKQVPGSGTKSKEGSVVRLTIAEPAAVEVPKLRGLYLSGAKKKLEQAGLNTGKVRRIEDPERGENYVLRQSPSPGDKVPPGTEVELTVVAPN
ncbi:MAG: PASTA domain-containing protein [Nannocystaceae bacterium]|nr:PASTA domain-containing protein [bacterium]